jgi:hypothetical protein
MSLSSSILSVHPLTPNRSARLSILFSIIRIDPSGNRHKRAVAVLFVVLWFVLTAQIFWVCEPEPHWKDTRSPQCVLDKQVAICQLVCE